MGLAAGALATSATAQTALPLDQRQEAPSSEKIGGTLAVDLIALDLGGPGTPLRFGNVIAGSERLTLDGRPLLSGRDYAIDYATGVVYLKMPAKANQSLTVSYRYDSSPIDAVAASRLKGLTGSSFSLMPGANLLMGMGYAERTADGRVMRGNAFGWNNSFKFGQSSLSGVFVSGQRTQSRNSMGLNMDSAAKPGEAGDEQGDSRLMLQSFDTKALGGRLKVDYQDVSGNFAAFSALRDSGLDEGRIAQLRSERGLTRLGYSMDGVKVGALALSNGYRKVSDEKGTVEWRTYGLQSGGLKLNYDSRTVGRGFGRFKDISETERDQLARETGMVRQNWSGEFAAKTSKLTFNSTSVEDESTGKAVVRSSYGFESKRFGFAYDTQEVEAGFARMDSLTDPEKGQYGRESGLRRQRLKLNAAITGDKPWTFDQSRLDGPLGSYVATDFGAQGKTWGLTHTVRKADSGFTAFNGMQDAEQDGNINSIARMYGTGVVGSPNDRLGLSQSGGVERSYTAFNAQPFKGWKLDIAQLDLRGKTDGGKVLRAGLDTGRIQLTYRQQKLGERFEEQTRLMGFEQGQLSTIVGLDRTDLGLKMNLGGARQFNFEQMSADAADGGLRRMTAQYTDKRIDIQMKSREVDSGFGNVTLFADAEKDLFSTLRGFSQRELSLKWQVAANLNLTMLNIDSDNSMTDTASRLRNLNVDWRPDSKTGFQYTRNEFTSNDPLGKLFDNFRERFAFSRDFGKLGKLELSDERQSQGGRNNSAPDIRKQSVAYQTKLTQTTDARTEQIRTDFADGSQERVSANTVSTALSKRAGVSVTDQSINRSDDTKNEKRRDYGFWVDLGKGVRFSYGYARQLLGDSAGQYSSTVSIGQNANRVAPEQVGGVQSANIQNVNIGGGYGVNQWDQDQRTQGFTNISVSSAKPMKMGLFQNVNFQFGMDSSSDRAVYQKDNQVAKIGWGIGSNTFGYEYMSQWSPLGARGIDRIFKFSTDNSDKRLLTASVFYKARTLPTDEQIMVRDYNLALRPGKNLTLTHQLQTNPELARPDLILGSLPQAARSNKWGMDYKRTDNFTVGLAWQELINDLDNAKSRTGGITMSLFGGTGSPLKLFYGVEQSDGNVARQTRHRYSVQFDQKAGANQSFSLFLGNLNYEHNIQEGLQRNNWTMRLNYQLRF
ncbi:hypothetical protein EON79_01360 [bacterium]|nr:MAG: hypothetical protein EON79_01360 [bacterium]